MPQTIYLQQNATDKDIASALASLTGGGTVVLPKDATISVNSSLLVKIDAQDITLDLNGSTLKTANLSSGIDVYGAEKPLYGVALGSDGNGNTTLTYDQLPAGMAVGEWLKVVSDDALPGDHLDAGDNGNATNLGQAAQITAINGNTVTLSGSLLDQDLYTTNVRAGLYADGSFTIKNGSIEGPLTGDYASSGQPLLRVRSLTDTSISNLTLSNAADGITLVNNVNAKITDVSGTNLYSVAHSATSLNTTIDGLFAEHVAHGVLVHTTGTVDNNVSPSNYGADIGLKAENSVVYDAEKAAYDFHSESRDGLYTNDLAFNSRMFGDLRGIGNSFTDSAGAGNDYGIQFYEYGDGDGRDAVVDNLTLRETTNYSFVVSGKPMNNVVENSSFESYGSGYNINPASVALVNTTVRQRVVGVDDTLTGTGAADKLLGGEGVDSLSGLGGHDYLWGGAGADTLTGGTGRDRFAYNALDEGEDVITDFATGNDGDVIDVSVLGIRMGWDQGDYLKEGLVRAVQSGTDTQVQAANGDGNWTTLATLENVVASSFTAANLQVKLSQPLPADIPAGTDRYGTDANNTIVGSTGADIFHGSAGNDSYTFNNAGDTIADGPDDGVDTVWATIGVDMRAHDQIENIRLKDEAGNATVFGNDADNLITGNASDNVIVPGLGVDSMYGDGGADTFVFGEADGTAKQGIWDFSDDDRVALESRFFVGLDKDGDGKLDDSAFAYGKVATTSGPQVLYDKNSGNLYYDSDGTGSKSPQLIVTMPTSRPFFGIGNITLL